MITVHIVQTIVKKNLKILTKTLKIFLISIASIIGSIWLIQFINDFRLTDMDNSIDVSNLITHNFTNPNDIEMISLFNSEAGHIFNDSSNLETSMKHYFDAPNNNCLLYTSPSPRD